MGHKNHEHHHHKEMETKNVASGIPYSGTASTYKLNESEYERARKDEKHHKRMGHLGEMGAAAAGAFAMVLHISFTH